MNELLMSFVFRNIILPQLFQSKVKQLLSKVGHFGKDSEIKC